MTARIVRYPPDAKVRWQRSTLGGLSCATISGGVRFKHKHIARDMVDDCDRWRLYRTITADVS